MQPIWSKHQGHTALWWHISKYIVIQWLLEFFRPPGALKLFLITWLKYAERPSILNMWLYEKKEYFALLFVLEKIFAPVLILESTVSSSYFIAYNRNKHCDLKPLSSVINHIFLPWDISLRKQFNLINCLQYSLRPLIHLSKEERLCMARIIPF